MKSLTSVDFMVDCATKPHYMSEISGNQFSHQISHVGLELENISEFTLTNLESYLLPHTTDLTLSCIIESIGCVAKL